MAERFKIALHTGTNLFLAIVLALVTFYSSLTAIKSGTLIYLEYNKNWTPTDVLAIGEDLWLQGTVIKPTDCDYFPPPFARVSALLPNVDLVVHSWSATKKMNWPASPYPRTFGWWQVVGGAKYSSIDFFQTFDCFDVLPIGKFTVYLGTVAVPK